MTLKKAAGEHHVGALLEIQAWKREVQAGTWLFLAVNTVAHHHLVLCAVANQVTPVRCERSRIDPAGPRGQSEPSQSVP